MREIKIVIQETNGVANFINFGAKTLIGSSPIFKIHRRGRIQTGFEINGKVFTDPYKAIKNLC